MIIIHDNYKGATSFSLEPVEEYLLESAVKGTNYGNSLTWFKPT